MQHVFLQNARSFLSSLPPQLSSPLSRRLTVSQEEDEVLGLAHVGGHPEGHVYSIPAHLVPVRRVKLLLWEQCDEQFIHLSVDPLFGG